MVSTAGNNSLKTCGSYNSEAG